MRPKILTIGIVSLLFGSILFGMFGFVGEVEAKPDDWIEGIIANSLVTVNAVAMGDVDNDGNNEIVIGMKLTTNELRAYRNIDGMWVEEIIGDVGNINVRSLAIGDADNDGFNDVIIGLETAANEVLIYKKDGGTWWKNSIANPGANVQSVSIGDADNDGNNEVVIGMDSASNQVRAYEFDGVNWVEDFIADVPVTALSLAIGDADNDGNNEVVVGLENTTNEVRAYENVTGVWVEENITDIFPNAHVLSVAIGDADNDDNNEVVIGLESTFDEVRMLKYSGTWVPESIANVPSDVNSVKIGDADNDDKNEVVIGMTNTTGEVRIYKKDGTWSGTQIADVPADVWSVAIGDADNDGKNDVAIGMGITTNEVRLYTLDKGQITFTSHKNGDYVSGTTTFEVLVTSNFVDAVKFYVNNEPKFTDSSYPYQFINDTTKLMEDATYTIKAEGLRNNAPPLIATVDVIVNNAVQTEDYITVSTLKNEYGPDQEVSVIVSTKTPPSYDSLNLVVSYTDPTGNTMSKMEESLPSTTQYIIILPLSSDAALGTYTVTANAYGYDGEVLIWEATNDTTFNVSGKSLHEQLADLYAQHDALNNSITSLSDVVENEHEFSRSEILDRINTSIIEIQGIDDIINDHDSEIKGILNSLNSLVKNQHNLTKDELLDELSEVLSQLQGVDDDVTSEVTDVKTTLAALDADLAALDQDLDATKDDVESVSEAQDLYAIIAIVLLVIALIILIIGMFLTMKANKMLKGFGGGPGMEMPYEEKIEPEVEHVVEEEPYEEPEKAMEESADVIDEIVEELEEPPKKKSGRGKKKK
jgi:hypothetical protein